MTKLRGVTALVLAGKRDGKLDPLAERYGVSHKCLAPIGGRPLIEHVLVALAASPEIARIIVSIDDRTAIAGLAPVRELQAADRLMIVPSQANIGASVVAAAHVAHFPLMITTADNILLTPEAVATMQRQMTATGADVGVAFARRAAVLAAHPEGQRRFYDFADDGYSNCNCYWISDADALQAADVFRQGGQFAKHPWRIASAFGLLNLIRFRLGIGTLERALERFSQRLALEVRPVIFEDGALAIDVDNERTYAIAAELLARRPRPVIAAPSERPAAEPVRPHLIAEGTAWPSARRRRQGR